MCELEAMRRLPEDFHFSLQMGRPEMLVISSIDIGGCPLWLVPLGQNRLPLLKFQY